MLVVWSLVQWCYARPELLIFDWHSWRQADTQSIAMNFLGHFDILEPQINWGGSGPGYVESEFQLYPSLITLIMYLTLEGEWQGQLISLVAMGTSGLMIYLLCCRKNGPLAAFMGLLVFLSSLNTMHLATSIMPDSLCFLFYVISLYFFVGYLEREKAAWLVFSCFFSVLAVLVKPPALHLGAIQFAFVVFSRPTALKRYGLWLHWFTILAVLGLYYVHANSLYREYGHTFGIGLEGDRKLPTFQELLTFGNYYKLAAMSMQWGITFWGFLAGCILLLYRKFDALTLALGIGIVLHYVVSMRYSRSVYLGTHYHIFAILLGAYIVAQATDVLLKRGTSKGILSLLFACVIVTMGVQTYRRHSMHQDRNNLYFALGTKLQKVNSEQDRVIIRSESKEFANNYEDPRILYVANAKGWVISSDMDRLHQFQAYVTDGAKYYVQPNGFDTPNIQQWLKEHSTLVHRDKYGAIFRVR